MLTGLAGSIEQDRPVGNYRVIAKQSPGPGLSQSQSGLETGNMMGNLSAILVQIIIIYQTEYY